MRGKAIQVAIAMVVFLALNLLFLGAGEGRLYGAIGFTLVFGMIYAAILAAVAMFRGSRKE